MSNTLSQNNNADFYNRMINLRSKFTVIILAFIFPIVSFAAQTPANLGETVGMFTSIITLLAALLFIIAFLVFLIGIVKFISRLDNDEARKEGKKWMVWGVIALFIMVGLYGILTFVSDQFGFGPIQAGIFPELKTESNTTNVNY